MNTGNPMFLSQWKQDFPPGKYEVCARIKKWVKDDYQKITQDNFRVDTNFEANLPHNLYPGEKTSVTIFTRSPIEPGKYTIHIDLLHRNIAYFSEYGNKELTIPVQVLGLSPKKHTKLWIK